MKEPLRPRGGEQSQARGTIPGLLLFILASSLCSLPPILFLSARSEAGARTEALVRASSLARAAYLRLLEARQEPAALLTRREENGESRFEAYRLPWSASAPLLYVADTLHDMEGDAARVLPPAGYTNGRAYWALPSRLAEERAFFLTTEERRKGGARPLAGLDGFLPRETQRESAKDAQIPSDIRVFGAAHSPLPTDTRVLAPARPDSLRRAASSGANGGFAAPRLFFERRRSLERQRTELLALLEAAGRGMEGISLSLVSDGAALFSGRDGEGGANLTASELRALSFAASGESEPVRAFPLGERGVRAIFGFDQNTGLAIVDIRFRQALSPLELGLLLVSVFIPFAAFVAIALYTGWRHTRQLFLFAALFTILAGFLLCREARDDYRHRAQDMEIFTRDFTESHALGEHAIQRLLPELWEGFAAADMSRLERQGEHGIYIIAAATGLLAFIGVVSLSPFLRAQGRFWRGAPVAAAGALIFLALMGTIFIAFPEYAPPSRLPAARLAPALLTGFLLLLAEIALACPLSFFLSSLSRFWRALILAAMFVPFFLSPVFFEFLARFVFVSEAGRDILWYALRFLSVLPVSVSGLLFAETRIPESARLAMRLASESRMRRFFSMEFPARFMPAFPIFALSYYLLLDAYPARVESATGPGIFAFHGPGLLPFLLLALTMIVLSYFLRMGFFDSPRRG